MTENDVLAAIVGAWTLVKLTTLSLRHRQQARTAAATAEARAAREAAKP